MLAIAFSCYHAIKLSHFDEILSCFASGHHCQVLDRLMGYAKAFSSKIVNSDSVIQTDSNSGYRQSSSRVPGQSASSFSSAVPEVRASPTVQAHGARSSFVAQADTAMPVAWGLQQT